MTSYYTLKTQSRQCRLAGYRAEKRDEDELAKALHKESTRLQNEAEALRAAEHQARQYDEDQRIFTE